MKSRTGSCVYTTIQGDLLSVCPGHCTFFPHMFFISFISVKCSQMLLSLTLSLSLPHCAPNFGQRTSPLISWAIRPIPWLAQQAPGEQEQQATLACKSLWLNRHLASKSVWICFKRARTPYHSPCKKAASAHAGVSHQALPNSTGDAAARECHGFWSKP